MRRKSSVGLRTSLAYASKIRRDPLQLFVLRNAGFSMALRLIGIALSYLANVLLSRLLGMQAYGEYVIALSWALVLTLAAKAGFDNSALRYSTVYYEKGNFPAWRGFIHFAAAVVTLSSIAIGTLIYLAGQKVIPIEDSTSFWAGLLVLPLALLAFFSVILRTTRRILAAQFYEQILRPTVIVAGAACAALAGIQLSASSAMELTAFAAFAAVLALMFQLRAIMRPARSHRPRFGDWSEWLVLSVPMFVLSVVQELLNQIDIILLGQFADDRQAALFAASWRLASLVPFALAALTMMSGPLIAAAHDRRAADELHRVSSVTARAGFAFALVSAGALYILGEPLLGIFGPGFVEGRAVLSVLLIGGIVNAFTGAVAYFMTLTGHERQALAIFTGSLVLSVGLNMLLIPRFGAIGSAVASSTATAAWNLAMLIYVRRTLGIDASALALAPRITPTER